MKTIIIAAALVVASLGAQAAKPHTTRGYISRDGRTVGPSYATNPNATKVDNYGTRGNTNPYTGKPGTTNADR